MWYGAQRSLVLVAWHMFQESIWPIPVVVLCFAAYRLRIAVRAWLQEAAAVSRDFDNFRRRLQIYSGPGNLTEEAKDVSALVTFWIARLWNTMSRPQLALLYREAQRDSPHYLRQQICDFLKEKYHTDPPHWTWVALDTIIARTVFVNLFFVRVSRRLFEPTELGPDPLSYLGVFLREPHEWPAKWADVLEKDIKRYGSAWYQGLVEHVEQRNDVGLWPPEVTTSHAERLEIILWILHEQFLGSRPLLSDRETAHRLHLRVPASLLCVPITKRRFSHETQDVSKWIGGIEQSSDRSILSLNYEPLPEMETLSAVIKDHRGWQIELTWNRLTLIACVSSGTVKGELAIAGKPPEPDQGFALDRAMSSQRGRKHRNKRRAKVSRSRGTSNEAPMIHS